MRIGVYYTLQSYTMFFILQIYLVEILQKK